MIYHDPPQAVLAQAEVITLFDPKVPGWKELVVRRQAGLKSGAGVLATIHIPVDSTDAAAVQAWRERIAAARQP